jgi:hypothetical protein
MSLPLTFEPRPQRVAPAAVPVEEELRDLLTPAAPGAGPGAGSAPGGGLVRHAGLLRWL